jgi:hypothetical protein
MVVKAQDARDIPRTLAHRRGGGPRFSLLPLSAPPSLPSNGPFRVPHSAFPGPSLRKLPFSSSPGRSHLSATGRRNRERRRNPRQARRGRSLALPRQAFSYTLLAPQLTVGCFRANGGQRRSSSAHEPQNAFVDFQQLAHLEVHGRNARKKFGVVSFWLGARTILSAGARELGTKRTRMSALQAKMRTAGRCGEEVAFGQESGSLPPAKRNVTLTVT